MARNLFPSDVMLVPGDLVTLNATPLPDALLAAGTPFTMWSDLNGGTDYTADLRAPDGVTVLPAVADASGLRPVLRGPDAILIMYCDAGGGIRFPVYSIDLLLMVAGLTNADPTANAIDLYLGGDASGLVNTVAGKAVLDPTTGKLRTDQLPAGGAVADATNTDRGVIRLAGDLAGSADAPTVVGLSGKATDISVVHKTGAETVDGVKTFLSAPVVPDDSFAIAKVSGLQAALGSGGSGGLLLDSAILTNAL